MSESIIGISGGEHELYGCPYCGYRSGHAPLHCGSYAFWICGDCDKTCVVMHESLTETPVGTRPHAKRLPHPRAGTPAHGRPDRPPEGGGEHFRSRGIGKDTTPGCFVCGGERRLYDNIAAFVQCKEAGERIVAMFPRGAYLDHREREPDRVQVKIGACSKHVKALRKLDQLDGVIRQSDVEAAIGKVAA